MIGPVLLDLSAWARFEHGGLPERRVDELVAASEGGRLVTCMPFLLEAGYSAQNARDHARVRQRLLALPFATIEAAVEQRALDAQAQLARAGHHRLPPPDLMIAALADHHGLGILHYDARYDLLLERTDLRFESVWLAPRGSL